MLSMKQQVSSTGMEAAAAKIGFRKTTQNPIKPSTEILQYNTRLVWFGLRITNNPEATDDASPTKASKQKSSKI